MLAITVNNIEITELVYRTATGKAVVTYNLMQDDGQVYRTQRATFQATPVDVRYDPETGEEIKTPHTYQMEEGTPEAVVGLLSSSRRVLMEEVLGVIEDPPQ